MEDNKINKEPTAMKKKLIAKITSNKKIENLKETSQSLTIKLPKDWVEYLLYLEKTTSKSKDYYVKEALFRYLEDLEDLQIGLKALKSKSRTYTSEEANERLKELQTMKGIIKSTSKNV